MHEDQVHCRKHVSSPLSPRALQKLQTSPFSNIIDKTTDVSTTKELAVVTRMYGGESMSIDRFLYYLLEVSYCDAESLFQALVRLFEQEEIPSSDLLLTPPMLCLGSTTYCLPKYLNSLAESCMDVIVSFSIL